MTSGLPDNVFDELTRLRQQAGLPAIGDIAAAIGNLCDTEILEAVFRRTASVQTSTVSAVMHLLRRMAAERGDPTPEISAKMSETEMAILRLIARGYTNKEIAAALCSNDHAIRAHVKRIHRTLGVRSNAHAVAIARDHGFTLPSGVFVARAGVERGS